MRFLSIVVIACVAFPPAAAADPSAKEILDKVVAKYQSLQTYKSEGTIDTDLQTGGMKMKQTTTFSILMKKPNQYVISWTQKGGPIVQSGDVWNDGSGAFLHMGALKSYGKMTSDDMALAAATGISGGAAFTVPSLFLPVFKDQGAKFSRLTNPKIEKTETVEGDDCYVISSASSISKEETYWISKQSHLIRRYKRSLETPKGKDAIPKLTDAEVEAAVESLGQEVNDESKRKMREMMEQTRKSLSSINIKGTTTETHKAVSSPELGDPDFKFAPPPGAVLKDSLLGGF